MKETGILFTPPNHRLIRGKTKTQTRRVAPFPSWVTKVDHVGEWFGGEGIHPSGECEHPKCAHIGAMDGNSGPSMFTMRCPYGRVGDRLYVKEGIIRHVSIPQLVGYYMDGCMATEPWEKRMTAMFMPKWAARTWLEITEIKVEQVQDISDDDAIAEGIAEVWGIIGANGNGGVHNEEHGYRYFFDGGNVEGYETPVGAYAALWDSINRKKHPWENNDLVWALTFRLVE